MRSLKVTTAQQRLCSSIDAWAWQCIAKSSQPAFVSLCPGPWQPKLVHLDGQLEDVVETLALCLRLLNIVTPNIARDVSHQLGE